MDVCLLWMLCVVR